MPSGGKTWHTFNIYNNVQMNRAWTSSVSISAMRWIRAGYPFELLSSSFFRNNISKNGFYSLIWAISRVGTNFWPKIGKFFPEEWFQILKKPFDVKKSSDSKYSIFISVSRREVHEILVFKHQKLVFSWFEGEGQKNSIFLLTHKG